MGLVPRVIMMRIRRTVDFCAPPPVEAEGLQAHCGEEVWARGVVIVVMMVAV